MKSIQLLLASWWAKLLAVLLVTAVCSSVNAAYWNRNRSQTHAAGRDLDGDCIPNIVDPDIDNDGIPNVIDQNIDGGIAKSGPYAGQYIGDHIDNDSASEEDIDDDGLADDSLAENDIDGDGKADGDPLETDIDGDGRADDSSAERDIDGDGRDDDSPSEDDIDGDGLDNDDAMEQDIDGDAKNDSTDDDIDGDGKLNDDPADTDIDGDGRSNNDSAEKDDDGDGLANIDDDDDNNNGLRDVDDSRHHEEEGENEVQSDLAAQPPAPNGSSVMLTLQRFGTNSTKFHVGARDLAVGNYDLLVGGVARGTLVVEQVSSRTRGDLTFKTSDSGSGDLILDFPVATQAVEIRQGATSYFSGTAPALPPLGTGGSGEQTVPLTRGPGIPNLAEAEIVLHFGTNGPRELEVGMAKVPAGTYSVVVGDATRGTLQVTGTAPDSEGELSFQLAPVSGSLPLDFPTAGQSISLVQGTTTWFFGQLPTSAAP